MGKTKSPTAFDRLQYDRTARTVLGSQTPEDMMESVPQATQRAITLASLAQVTAARTDVHVFNELLVLYPKPTAPRGIGQVAPDNMVVVFDGPIEADGSFNVPWQPAGPLVVLEYANRNSERKDYERNLPLYETDLKVPYFVLFYLEARELILFRRKRGRYAALSPNARGRLAIPELELELAVEGGWVRYWFRGKLLPLTAELLGERDAARGERDAALAAAAAERQARETAEAELARLRAELERLRK